MTDWLYDVRKVARLTGRHPNAVWRDLWEGLIPHYWLSPGSGKVRGRGVGTVRVSRADARAYAQGRGVAVVVGNGIPARREYLSFEEVAVVLSISRAFVYKLAEDGELPWTIGPTREGKGPKKSRLVAWDDLEEWLVARKRRGRA